MKILLLLLFYYLIPFCIAQSGTGTEERIKELNNYWAEVSRSVREGDFQGYKATCHKEGVLVSGTNNSSYPLSDALARWKKDFTATKEGKMKASVEFRFSKRISDPTTAHETGIFLYSSGDSGENPKKEYIHFQALLVKTKGGWKIMMEYQKSKASQVEWNKLAAK
ncbi:hypothetical protein OAF65_02865 [Verrucomicrobiales bacterium]|jgi:hypothetical protein|nr:hypothetical protein [Verrucomicrobiales bacterium]|tara:strand:- start:297 stop:794 length:498 start_codon:yes stop_codon:yes gene_type:complete